MNIDKQYCSPTSKDNNATCLSKESLKILIDTYNKSRKTKKEYIKYYDNNSQIELFKKLDNKMKKYTKGSKKYWLWPDIINKMTPVNNYNITIISKNELIPKKPKSWLKNKKEWLSNYDIDNVMKQYCKCKKYQYKYIGTFSIDFAVKDNMGLCLHSNFCDINIQDYLNKNINKIGFITNLDKHDQPGSHWTSTFIHLNVNSNTFGAYYYDSVSRKIPVLIMNFINKIKLQCKKIYPNKKFNIKYNYLEHQKKNTECGMFSIIYQLRWIENLQKNKNTTFKDIINNKNLTDENANKMRNYLFR